MCKQCLALLPSTACGIRANFRASSYRPSYSAPLIPFGNNEMASVTSLFSARFNRWLSRRIPAAKEQRLSHRSIFILPSGFGVIWLALVLLLFLFGTNYQNNLVIGLAIVLASVFHTCIIHSYRNLAGLRLSARKPPQAYAGDSLSFPVTVSADRSLFRLGFSYPGERQVFVSCVDNQEQTALVPMQPRPRGLWHPGRLKVESCYPLGLCRAWSHLDLDTSQWVFPAPVVSTPKLGRSEHVPESQDSGEWLSGVDEYAGLKSYVPGESLKQVAWKQWAQGRGMLSKEFAEPQGAPLWLELDSKLTGDELEKRLGELSYQVNQLAHSGQTWGLKLAGRTIAPSQGEAQRQECLKALALYPTKAEGTGE
ncbi:MULTISPECIES: DUF58 domain-containing protein [Shewanella]|nr:MULTISPECIES: DUF58 domain-containing protein [Shewanella]